MKHRCKVVGCSSSSNQPEVKFFAFPKANKFCKLWVAFTRNAALEERWLKKRQITRSSSRICCKHFQDSDFTNCWKERLNRGVVPSLNGPSISPRPPQASDKAVIVDCFARKQSSLAFEHNYVKEENTSDEFHFEVTEENLVTDEQENVSEYPIACSNEDISSINPTLGKTVTTVSAGNCEEDIGNNIGSGSDCENAPNKKIKVSLSDKHELKRLCPSPVVSPGKKREGFTIERRTLLLNKSNSSNNKVSVEDSPNIDPVQTSFVEPKQCNNAKFRLWLKRIESYLSKSNISPKMHYCDLVSAKNDLNSVYMKVIEKSAEILEKIPIHILKEITGFDSSVFIEMKSIRKMLSAKQKLIISYLRNKESEDVLNSDSCEIQRQDTGVQNEHLYFTSLTLDSLTPSGEQCKNQAQTPSSVSSSVSVQLPQSPLIKGREITQLSSVNCNTLQNALSSESSSDWTESDRVLTNNEKSNKRQSYDVTGNSFTDSGPYKFRTSSQKTNSRTAISQDCPFLPVESTMNLKIGCETSVGAIGTKAQFVQEMSGTNVCNRASEITPSSLKSSPFNHCLPAFQPKESAAGPSKVTRESQHVTINKVKKRAETNTATKSGGVAKARARKVDGMATSKNSSSSEASKSLN